MIFHIQDHHRPSLHSTRPVLAGRLTWPHPIPAEPGGSKVWQACAWRPRDRKTSGASSVLVLLVSPGWEIHSHCVGAGRARKEAAARKLGTLVNAVREILYKSECDAAMLHFAAMVLQVGRDDLRGIFASEVILAWALFSSTLACGFA